MWTTNPFVARIAGALSCNSSDNSSIYAVEVTIFLQRTVTRSIVGGYTVKKTPGGITNVAFSTCSTVWTTNIIIARSARARSSKTTNGSSIYAVEVAIRAIIKWYCGGNAKRQHTLSERSLKTCNASICYEKRTFVKGGS
jgi:hypothetical protein